MIKYLNSSLNIIIFIYLIIQTVFHIVLGAFESSLIYITIFTMLFNLTIIYFIFHLRHISNKWLILPLVLVIFFSVIILLFPITFYGHTFNNNIYIVNPMIIFAYLITIINILMKFKYKIINISIIIISVFATTFFYSLYFRTISDIANLIFVVITGLLPFEAIGFVPIVLFLILKDKSKKGVYNDFLY